MFISDNSGIADTEVVEVPCRRWIKRGRCRLYMSMKVIMVSCVHMEPVSGPHVKAKIKETRAIIVMIGYWSRRSITRISSATRASRHSIGSLLCDPETFHCFGSGKSYPWR